MLALLAAATAWLALATLSLAAPVAAPSAGAVLAWLSDVQLARRTLGTGHLNLTRDYVLQLDQAVWSAKVTRTGLPLPALFASALHTACINEANTKDEHHVIDIAPEQPNVAAYQLFAFCGGQAKIVIGGITNENGTGPVIDNTAAMLALEANEALLAATVFAPPMTLAACIAYKAAHPGIGVICG